MDIMKAFPEDASQSHFIHFCPQALKDTYTYFQTTGQALCKMQVPGELDNAGRCLLAGKDHVALSAPLQGHAAG